MRFVNTPIDSFYKFLTRCKSDTFAIVGGILLSLSTNMYSTLMFGVSTQVPKGLFFLSSTSLLLGAIGLIALAQKLSFIASVEDDEREISDDLSTSTSLVEDEKPGVMRITAFTLVCSTVGLVALAWGAATVN